MRGAFGFFVAAAANRVGGQAFQRNDRFWVPGASMPEKPLSYKFIVAICVLGLIAAFLILR